MIFTQILFVPWCYIGKKKLKLAIDDFPDINFNIIWRPFQLNPNMPLEGINRKLYYKKKFGGDDQALKMYNNIKEVGKKKWNFFSI